MMLTMVLVGIAFFIIGLCISYAYFTSLKHTIKSPIISGLVNFGGGFCIGFGVTTVVLNLLI